MSRKYRNLLPVQTLLQRLAETGAIEPTLRDAALKTLRRLQHALNVRDVNLVRKHIDEFSRLFVKTR